MLQRKVINKIYEKQLFTRKFSLLIHSAFKCHCEITLEFKA